MRLPLLRCSWLCVLFLTAPLAVTHAASEPARAPVGSARVIVAEVSAQADDAKRRLAVADAVKFRELISTAADSAAAIVLIEGTELAMGENAQVRLDEFVLGDGPEARLSLRVGLGALRFVTGTMPKPAYRISTPTASLTVRGTTFNLAVGADGSAYVAVQSGAVTVATASGQSIDLTAGQSLGIDAAGVAGLPRAASLTPTGQLPGMIAGMDLVLAQHIAGLAPEDLPELSVLGPSRALARDLGPRGLPDGPGLDGGKNRPDLDKSGHRDKSERGDKGGKGKKSGRR